MARLQEEAARAEQQQHMRAVLLAWLARRPVKFGIWTLAGLACAVRILAVIGLFLPQ
jgi:hypothetical protein